MKIKKIILISLCALMGNANAKDIYVAAPSGNTLPVWEAGYLDIHHINTGCGNATFCILPDGTTMLIDAGENKAGGERHVLPKPNDSKSAGQWIADYIKMFSSNANPVIDYCLVTHFHKDHIGGILKRRSPKADFYLTGISEVNEFIPIKKIVDRGYPDYNFIKPEETEAFFYNYLAFLEFFKNNNPDGIEGFNVGSADQFVLKHNPDAYKYTFEIRNLIANGNMWTGKEKETKNLFPDLTSVNKGNWPNENSLSCAIKMSYGKFNYYTGGDLTGYPKPGRPSWHDLETPLAPVIGEVEVCVVNHHGYDNATNDTFVSVLKPQVFVMHAWDALHPNHSTLTRMLAKQLYPNARDVFSTNMLEATRIVIGDLTDQMKSRQGHIVVRVSPGGNQYMIYILEDGNTQRTVKSSYGPYVCR